jgi:hypothetical protein
MNERKAIQDNIALKRKRFSAAKKALKGIRATKCKLDRPVRAEIQNILAEFHISSAAYHDGDLNGVCCRRFMANAKEIFANTTAYLKGVPNSKCPDAEVDAICEVYIGIFSSLDIITSKL